MSRIKFTNHRFLVLIAVLLVVAASAAMAQDLTRKASGEIAFLPLQPRFTFVLERNGAVAGFFTEVTGLGSENEVIEFRDGNDPNLTRKLPGVAKFGDVTLKRGITSDLMAWNWREEVLAGVDGFQSDVTIRMLNRDGIPVATWRLLHAWPSKVTGPTLNAAGNSVAIEEIVLVCEGLRRDQ